MFLIPPRTVPPTGETRPSRALLVRAVHRGAPQTSLGAGVVQRETFAPTESLNVRDTLQDYPINALNKTHRSTIKLPSVLSLSSHFTYLSFSPPH